PGLVFSSSSTVPADWTVPPRFTVPPDTSPKSPNSIVSVGPGSCPVLQLAGLVHMESPEALVQLTVAAWDAAVRPPKTMAAWQALRSLREFTILPSNFPAIAHWQDGWSPTAK